MSLVTFFGSSCRFLSLSEMTNLTFQVGVFHHVTFCHFYFSTKMTCHFFEKWDIGTYLSLNFFNWDMKYSNIFWDIFVSKYLVFFAN